MKKILALAAILGFAIPAATAQTASSIDYGNDKVSVAEQAQAASAKHAYERADKTYVIDIDMTGRKQPAAEPAADEEAATAEEDNAFAALEDAYMNDDEEADEDVAKYKPNQDYDDNWPYGLQFGAGFTIMPGHNWMVGYANKEHKSFWWKRIGGRLDMTTPMTINAKAIMSDTANGYELKPEVNLWFHKQTFPSFKMDQVEIDDTPLSFQGTQAALDLRHKNFGALLDIYPFGNTWFLGGWRLTGGYYTGSLELGANAFFPNHTPTGGFVQAIDNTNDELKFRVKGGSKFGTNINWRYSGPYVGLGFDLGLLLGAKIYFDAGAVYTKPLRIREKDIDDRNLVIEACYAFDGSANCDWTTLAQGMNTPNVDSIVQNIVARALAAQIEANLNGGAYGGFGVPGDSATITSDLADFLINGTTNSWITDVASSDPAINDTLNQIRDEVMGTAGGDTIQDQIDSIWGDYNNQKRDAINDANKALNDCGDKCKFMPMVRLGLMYRF
ncbi:MAG: hypothetical protein LBG89_02890 [Rickettsiales bacterium]|jgi:hypothetical protein|nr:hypothetical protein [Rickettsiales bacterium]